MPLPRFGILATLASLVAVTVSAAAPDDTRWRLDNLQALGGKPLTVLGEPHVIAEGGEKAMVFNGSSDGIFVPTNPLAGAPSFTIEVFFKPEEGGLEAQRFFHLQDTKTWRVMIETRLDGKGHWWLDTFLGANGASYPMIEPKLMHPTGQWYWIALRFDGNRMTSYVNGVQELEREAKFGPMVDGQLSLGVRQNKVFWFKGAIREVRWHREALPKEKLQKL
jgi:hypothetical protein